MRKQKDSRPAVSDVGGRAGAAVTAAVSILRDGRPSDAFLGILSFRLKDAWNFTLRL